MNKIILAAILALSASSAIAEDNTSRDVAWSSNACYTVWQMCGQPAELPSKEQRDETSEYVDSNMLWSDNLHFQVYNMKW